MKIVKYTVIFVVIIAVIITLSGKGSLLYIRARTEMVDWEAVMETPDHEKEYPPQGLVIIEDKLIISTHSFDTKTNVHEISLDTLEILRSFDMPRDAVHSGGLTYDGTYLYAVDYKTNMVYQMNYEASFSGGKADVIGSFDTTLVGDGACCIVNDDKLLMAISDFSNSKKTIFVDLTKALEDKTAANNILYSYKNEGFSQGLAFWDGKIYETENKAYKSIINVYDFEKIKSGDRKESFLGQFFGPDLGGQDLCIYDGVVWTSDAVTFNIYKGRLMD